MADHPLNCTTKIPVRQTVGECSELLANAGAARVAVVYENKQAVGLSFRLEMSSGWQDFTLPVNVPAMAALLSRMKFPPKTPEIELKRHRAPGHAAEVAWRWSRTGWKRSWPSSPRRWPPLTR